MVDAPATSDDGLIAQHARTLLADPLVGDLIRQATGVASAGRRTRHHAMEGLLLLASRYACLRPALALAAGLAWHDRFEREFAHIPPSQRDALSLTDVLAELQGSDGGEQ